MKRKQNLGPKEPKGDKLEFDGVVQEALPNAMFRVGADNGLDVLATISGRMRRSKNSSPVSSFSAANVGAESTLKSAKIASANQRDAGDIGRIITEAGTCRPGKSRSILPVHAGQINQKRIIYRLSCFF